jgi:hypothetical protein
LPDAGTSGFYLAMDASAPNAASETLPAVPDNPGNPVARAPTAAGHAALQAAQTLARNATAPATLRAYKIGRAHV